jgi:gliding motility-associated-like protein
VKRIFILIGFCGFFWVAKAQPFTSNQGKFTVDQITFCAGYTITVTSSQCDPADPTKQCATDFDNKKGCRTPPVSQNLSFKYDAPGDYKLTVCFLNVSLPDDITIKVFEDKLPVFEVSSCTNEAYIKITDTYYNEYAIDFGLGAGFSSPSPTRIYRQPYSVGPHTIQVRGYFRDRFGRISASNCTPSSQTFEVYANLPKPKIDTLFAIDNSHVKLDFTPKPNVQTRIDFSIDNLTFSPYKNSVGIKTETIPNLMLDDKYYCFRLSAFDPCINSPDNSTLTEPICSHNFDVTAKDGTTTDINGTMQLDWLTNTAIRRDVYRDNGVYQGNVPPSPFIDKGIVCNINYTYQLITTNSEDAKSVSLKKTAKSFTTIKPNTIANTSSVVSGAGVDLSWVQTPPFSTDSYSLFRSENQGTFFSVASPTLTQYQDNAYNSESQFCYLINYKDKCNNTSDDSTPICPIRLKGSIGRNNQISLSWNDYAGWNLGVKYYQLEKFDKNGGLISSISVGTDTNRTDDIVDTQNQIVSYRITAFPNEAGLKNSVSNQIVLTKEINLFYPTAFTPDGKPLPSGSFENETFTVRGQFIAKTELSIFDRWGSLIFYSDRNEPWDGRQNGQPMPIASYVWIANITDLAGRTVQRSGTVLLLRK